MKIIKINAMWCPGCLISKSIWAEIENDYPNHEYISLDYDLDEDIVEQYNVGDILPVVIFEEDITSSIAANLRAVSLSI